MLRKSFKLLSQKVFIPLLVLSFLVVGCKNSAAPESPQEEPSAQNEDVTYTSISGHNTSSGNAVRTTVFNFLKDGTYSCKMDGDTMSSGTFEGRPAQDGKLTLTVKSTQADDQDYTDYQFDIDISDGKFVLEGLGEFVHSVSTVAVYFYYESGARETRDNVAFYSDNTFSIYEEIDDFNNQTNHHETVFSSIVARGTYTGNPAADGTISVTVNKMMNAAGTALEDCSHKQDITISGGILPVTKSWGATVNSERVYPQ
ncbi:hypothetical protein SAMN04487775_106108 [Treponema bryantii]|uniref:Lipoprotein n=1 Tax=Treponema bryantii TaxID=163 RepID=A0A1I3L887_9SPIR|nr:hypothetical protein [Treponema bryantii]SFI80973.1 hypothetical protein SAMN04487775_106108 [Treponema bryantii]